MTTDPKVDFRQDIGSMDPAEAHDAWEEMTNLDAPALRELKDSKRNKVYLDKAENNQGSDNPPIEGGPLEDAIHLAETPRSEWGADERAEAEEARNFIARNEPQFDQDAGQPLLPGEEPRIHKDEIANMRWGWDPAPDDSFP